MKSFIEHTNEIDEEVLDNKPKEAVDEAAGMGDLLIGLGAAGGLLALKKGWDAFGKGSKFSNSKCSKNISVVDHNLGFPGIFFLPLGLTQPISQR